MEHARPADSRRDYATTAPRSAVHEGQSKARILFYPQRDSLQPVHGSGGAACPQIRRSAWPSATAEGLAVTAEPPRAPTTPPEKEGQHMAENHTASQPGVQVLDDRPAS